MSWEKNEFFTNMLKAPQIKYQILPLNRGKVEISELIIDYLKTVTNEIQIAVMVSEESF